MLGWEQQDNNKNFSWENGIYWCFIGILSGALLGFICLAIWSQ